MHRMVIDDTYASWRDAARLALASDFAPESVEWQIRSQHDPVSLFDGESIDSASADCSEHVSPRLHEAPVRISKDFATILKEAALYRDPQRWSLLYHALWRWQHGDRAVANAADVDGAKLHKMGKQVRRAMHDMIAYVRFRKLNAPSLEDAGEATDRTATQSATASSGRRPEYLAWYAPDHDVLAWGAEHFAQRMGRSSWLIATPHGSAWWDGAELHIDAHRTLSASQLPRADDDVEGLWLAYYRSTFNPARLNESALEQHMPVRFWKGLPEGPLIPQMISEARAGARQVAQARQVGALPRRKAIPVEAEQAQPSRDAPSSLDECRRCELWRHATQAVPGAGPLDARIMLIGEQPGDQEDLAGRAFVGPAGQLLDEAIRRAQVDRRAVYLTNAVKHFKWEPRGKRRIHKTPAQREIEACGYWLDHEVASVKPRVIVTLGATALGALLKQKVSLNRYMDAPFDITLGSIQTTIIATWHPSYGLRQADDSARENVTEAIAQALRQARQCVAGHGHQETRREDNQP